MQFSEESEDKNGQIRGICWTLGKTMDRHLTSLSLIWSFFMSFLVMFLIGHVFGNSSVSMHVARSRAWLPRRNQGFEKSWKEFLQTHFLMLFYTQLWIIMVFFTNNHREDWWAEIWIRINTFKFSTNNWGWIILKISIMSSFDKCGKCALKPDNCKCSMRAAWLLVYMYFEWWY